MNEVLGDYSGKGNSLLSLNKLHANIINGVWDATI